MPRPDLQAALDAPYALTDAQKQQFRADGFIKLKDVFPADVLDYFGEAITRVTLAHNSNAGKPLAERDTYGRAFIQVGNLWEMDDTCKQFAFSKRLARLAAELMGVSGVRMYHDQALYKEAGGGFTPWHVDQQYWPLDTGNTVTAWVPLQATPMEMGPLQFGRGSHVKNIGRDLAISDESEQQIREMVKREGLVEVYEPFDLGEVSFHYGWTLHRAGPNTTDRPRKVMTVIYMPENVKLAPLKNPNQQADWDRWLPGVKTGQVCDSPLNPVLWSGSGA